MSRDHPTVSVIIPVFRPGAGLDRVVASLDEQTLPREEFDVIFVDDGSGDDTVERLRAIAAARANVRVIAAEHSGWPSRPRNLGIAAADGEYVLFMDHDDSLYPDGLRRVCAYAEYTGADVVSPKESKTNDVWWSLPEEVTGNVPDLRAGGTIRGLVPMVPHKLYRRRMLLQHNVRFPEGSRRLWEDWYINLGAYRYAKSIAVLADSPVYLWHASGTNTSHTFDPARPDYWDRMADLLDFASSTLGARVHHDARDAMIAHNMRIRVIDSCVRVMARSSAADKTRRLVLNRSARLLKQYGSESVMAQLPRKHQAQAHLMRARRPDLIAALHEADLSLTARFTTSEVRWDGRVLRYESEVRWQPKSPAQPGMLTRGGRVFRRVSPELERSIPSELLDVTDPAEQFGVRVAVRDRSTHVTWPLEHRAHDLHYAVNDAGSLCLIQRGSGSMPLDEAAMGGPLEPSLWDLHVRLEWDGMVRKSVMGYVGGPHPVVTPCGSAVAYSNQRAGLSVDLDRRTRTLATDASPRNGYAGPVGDFVTALQNVTICDGAELKVDDVVAIPDGAVPKTVSAAEQVRLRERFARSGALSARVLEEGSRAVLRGSADLEAGTYSLYGRRAGQLHRTRYDIRVDHTGHVHFNARS